VWTVSPARRRRASEKAEMGIAADREFEDGRAMSPARGPPVKRLAPCRRGHLLMGRWARHCERSEAIQDLCE
jgi:hypothetical protein